MHSDSSAADTTDPESIAATLTAMFGGSRRTYTRGETLQVLGISDEHAARIWRAFGLPHDPNGSPVFTDEELEALKVFVVADRTVPGENASERALQYEIATARTIGQTMSRLADWQAGRLAQIARDPRYHDSIPQLAKAMEISQTMVWRRHLVAALSNALSQQYDNDNVGEVETVVGFVDIVGYTSLTRRIDTEALTALLDAFESAINDIVVARGGQIIKSLGDGMLFVINDPSSAASAAISMIELSNDGTMPPVRVGLALGPVATRFGDVFGEPVNIAARLSGNAHANTVLVDTHLADRISDNRSFYLKSIPTLSVRGYRKLRAKALELNRSSARD